jgi:hypothetical protein
MCPPALAGRSGLDGYRKDGACCEKGRHIGLPLHGMCHEVASLCYSASVPILSASNPPIAIAVRGL